MLGTLENQAAEIISTIQARFEAGDKESCASEEREGYSTEIPVHHEVS